MVKFIQVYLLTAVVFVLLLPQIKGHEKIDIEELGKKIEEFLHGSKKVLESLGDAGEALAKVGLAKIEMLQSLGSLLSTMKRTKPIYDDNGKLLFSPLK